MTGGAARRQGDFPGRRWLGIVLRTAHIAGLVGVGGTLLGSVPGASPLLFAGMLIASGVGMMALDLWAHPGYVSEYSGAAMLLKLGLLAWLVIDAANRPALFWVVLVLSAVVAHAPARVRHKKIAQRGK